MMMRYSLGLPQFFSRWPNALRCRPIIGLSMALVVAIWSCTWVHINDERVSLQRASLQESVNLANLLEKNIARTIGEIDRLVVFVRSLHMQGVARDDWSKLIPARHVIEQQAIQISVVDARGLVIASSLGALPDTPIDVSDREHFRIHQGTAQDLLFISKPVVGRNSKKISIQLTRRFWNESGEFAGVIVASLDPIQLARTYDGIELGDGGGFAMVGTDDVIRAGSGVFARDVGYGIKDTHFRGNMLLSDDGVAVALVASGGRHRATSSRPVSGYPLFVIVAGRDVAQDPQWSALKWKYALGAGLLSLVVFVTMLVGLDWQRRSETRASYFARHDSLTGLANRAEFIEFLERTLNSRSSSNAFALHVIDLDKFKHVNDAFGQAIGNKLLQLVTLRLRENVRQTDFVARLGGDEFAIVQTGASSEQAAAILAARLGTVLSSLFVIDGYHIETGASIGIVLATADCGSATELMQSAELALHAAKKEGRACFRLYNAGMRSEADSRRMLERDLKGAIELGQLDVHYQPILETRTNRISGYEALVRWRHPILGMIPPLSFIPLAEETGLIVPLGSLVLNTACREVQQLGSDVKVAVNFSAVQFQKSDVVAVVAAALEQSGLSANRLTIEITESMVMQADPKTLMTLQLLRDRGVAIAMDDFGTGYSSLGYLQTYPIDCIKIDRSFVQSLGQMQKAAVIIKAIAALAAGLGMTTVAEGVETQEELDQLRAIGCDAVQGYFVSRPMPAVAILTTMQGQKRMLSAAA